ncbi:MAG TPA: hypothetical protein ENI89_13270 [Desulfobulbus sp.]|nr:hypothetical protein [Desulfobulbus sp.]
MSNRRKIEFVLELVDKGFRAGMSRTVKSINAFNKEANNGVRVITALEGAVGGMVGAFVGFSALRSATDIMKNAGDAGFNLEASLRAASREFSSIGTDSQWNAAISRLSKELRVYSDIELKNAAARTIDMTKRLGLSAKQMERVIRLTGDLSAGKVSLEGGVERVTAALRGEAESAEYLGLTLNENYVKAWYNAHGAMQGAWKDLNDMQKAQVRYQVFLEQAIPMHGRAASSVKTFSGALALARKEIENAVANNSDAVAAMKDLAAVIRENSGELGNLVSSLVTAAAGTAEWVLKNREAVLAAGKWTVKIYLLFKSFQVLGTGINILRGLNAAFMTLTGSTITSGLASLRAALDGVAASTTTLSVVFKGFLALAAADAVIKIGRLIAILWNWKKATDELAEAKRRAAEQKAWIDPKITSRLSEINQALGTNYRTVDELFAAQKRGEVAYDDLTGTWVRGAREMTDATKKQTQEVQQVTGKALEEMKKKYREYADEVRRIQDEIAGRERSLAEQLRAMARTGMSDIAAWRDRKKEAQEYERAAREAAEAGDFKTAVELADKAKQAYADLNREVKDGDRVLVSQNDALKTSMDGVKRAGELAISILKKQQDAAKKAMEDLTGKSGFQDLTRGMDESKRTWIKNWLDMRSASMRELDKVEKRIVAVTRDRHMKIYVDEVVRKAVGGMVARFASGGRLPGYGGGDRIPALLEAGEYIIRKEAVSHFGAGIFHALNNLRLPELPRFATGGPVAAGAGGSETININLSLPGSDGPVSMRADRYNAEKLLRDVERMRRLRSA